MDEQEQVAAFIEAHDMHATTEFRLLDLVSEVGEVAKDVNESTNYGRERDLVDVSSEELGDVLFAVLALADTADIDAGEALDEALQKYEGRIEETESPSSNDWFSTVLQQAAERLS